MTRPLAPLHPQSTLNPSTITTSLDPVQHANPVSHDESDDALIPHVTHDPDTGLPWPEPSVPEPEFVALALFLYDAVAISTDGCLVEPDGVCQHGHPSWLRRLGVI